MTTIQPITIRTEEPADRAAVHSLHCAAFGRTGEADLVDALRQLANFRPELSLVGLVDGVIVAHVLYSPIEIGSRAGVALAPMAVLPEHQRRGYGCYLLRKSLQRCAELRHEPVVVLGHPAFYLRAGFERASHYGITAPFDVPDEAFMVWASSPEKLAGVCGMVRYSAPFNAV